MVKRQSRIDFVRIALAMALLCGSSMSSLWSDPPGNGTDIKLRAALPEPARRVVDFIKDVQPLFAKRCYKCHGAEKQEAGLRLDLKQAALAGGDNGKSIEAGKSADSQLVQHVAGVDPDMVMPPKGERLTAIEVGLIRAWIDQGAIWPDSAPGNVVRKSEHWSFQPLKTGSLPVVKSPEWVRNPIDAFIMARLDKEGIAPAVEADRATLIRRLYLDLLGLIPSPTEVDEYLADSDPQAYEHLVQKVLASPHFGERWGRHWLDLARYADSDGYEKDTARPFAYRYRDWVINAINCDQSFDQFTIEQLAGDLLPNATLEQKMATGFHRNTLTNTEGGADQEEFRVAATVDRVNTLGSVWLGVTVGCAQCHSHKYDPFTQREYYQLFAFFNSIQEVNLPAPTSDEVQLYATAKAKFDLEHAPFLDAVRKFETDQLPSRQAAWEQTLGASPLLEWILLQPASVVSLNGATLTGQPDGSWLASGVSPDRDLYTITVKGPLKGITGFRLEVLPDDLLPSKGPGRVAHGNFVLSEFTLGITSGTNVGTSQSIVLKNPKADFEQGANGNKIEFPIANVLDGKSETGWAVANQFGVRHVAVFECAEPMNLDQNQSLVFRLDQQHGMQHTIGKLRLSATAAAPPLRLEGMPDGVVAALKIPAGTRNEMQRMAIAAYYRTVDPELTKLVASAESHQKKAPAEPATKCQMVQELPAQRATTILVRGDFLRKGDPVSVGTPAMLPAAVFDPLKSSRLDLACWLVDPVKNPLTPRVTVNLWWQYLFGRGLVATVEDFGLRGEAPSHPELLDWLATQFVAQKWSRKELIKLIVCSSTYRQSSRSRPELHDRDPKNIWLSHQNRFRLEAEAVRDLYLTSSGILNRTIGGASVRPPLPPGIAELGYAGSVRWPESTGSDKYRRGLYIFFQRTVPYPMLMAFDTPDSNSTCVRRERSNTPLQALTLLNDPVFFECAQQLGRRAVHESRGADTTERVRHIFRLCLGRVPTVAETTRLVTLQDELRRQISQELGTAEKLAGLKPLPGTELETAVAVAVSRIVLNLDEFVVRE
ncbi:MAG: Planctomycete cytochrome [Planctomycetaceae bacterium]|nr:Planctomycete cytochrome [Planctomycetaceae bacterium]